VSVAGQGRTFGIWFFKSSSSVRECPYWTSDVLRGGVIVSATFCHPSVSIGSYHMAIIHEDILHNLMVLCLYNIYWLKLLRMRDD